MPNSQERLNTALEGRYDIVQQRGAGGMAFVYQARDLKHDRDVALKVLRPELAANLGVDRFEREIRIAAQLEHPHILTLIDSGEADGLLYYVMPYIEGESLREKMDREGALPIPEAARILREVANLEPAEVEFVMELAMMQKRAQSEIHVDAADSSFDGDRQSHFVDSLYAIAESDGHSSEEELAEIDEIVKEFGLQGRPR